MSNTPSFSNDCAELLTRYSPGTYQICVIDTPQGAERLKWNGIAETD